MTKEYLLKESNKSEFMNFIENDFNGEILLLLDSEGIKYLSQYKYPSERISYILTYSKYCDQLFCNEEFLNFFFKTNIDDQYACLGNLKSSTYDAILKQASEKLNIHQKIQLLNYFNKEYTLNYVLSSLDNYNGELASLYILYQRIDHIEIKNKILNNFNLDLTKFDIYNFFKNAKEYSFLETDFSIPKHLITKKLIKEIINYGDIFKIREILENACYVIDIADIEKYLSDYEDKLILSYVNQDSIADFRTSHGYKTPSADFFLDEQDITLSNYIIDYHFKENYYNVMLDLKELLTFYYAGNINLSNEKVELYGKVANIDYLSIKEKKELHNYLKKFNIVEMFYDDMAYARYLVGEAIKNSSINKEELEKYKDEKLSKEYGVPVYKMAGEPFFGIVKSGISNFTSDKYPTGHSYSIIGNGGIGVYTTNTFVYDSDDLNPNQVVHVFPFDSYTLYKPFEHYFHNPTKKVNLLMFPDEITHLAGKYNTYNEILLLERGIEHTAIDKDIKKLKKIALYCVDQITTSDVKNAKEANVGIMLVPAKLYNKVENHPNSIYRHDIKPFEEYDYYNWANEYKLKEDRKNNKI